MILKNRLSLKNVSKPIIVFLAFQKDIKKAVDHLNQQLLYFFFSQQRLPTSNER